MSSPDFIGWLLTYAMHSTVLLILAWLVAGRVNLGVSRHGQSPRQNVTVIKCVEPSSGI